MTTTADNSVGLEAAASMSTAQDWTVGGHRVSRSFVVYIVQVLLIYLVVGTAIYKLTSDHCQSDQKLWVAILASCIGYILPCPAIKKNE